MALAGTLFHNEWESKTGILGSNLLQSFYRIPLCMEELYEKEDLEGSEKDFHDPYVERLQRCVREIKGNRGMEERFIIFEEMLRDERTAGREEGRIENAKETLFLLLQNFGVVSKELSVKIQTQQDSEVLKQGTQIAFQSKSLEEFNEKISL